MCLYTSPIQWHVVCTSGRQTNDPLSTPRPYYFEVFLIGIWAKANVAQQTFLATHSPLGTRKCNYSADLSSIQKENCFVDQTNVEVSDRLKSSKFFQYVFVHLVDESAEKMRVLQ